MARRPGWQAAAAAAVVAACLAVNAWHASRTTAPPTFDDAWYLETSIRLHRCLTHDGPAAFFKTYVDAFKTKAPLFSVLPLAFYWALGPWAAAQALNMAMLAVLGLYLFLLARRLYGETAALYAVGTAMTLPAVFGLSRVIQVENCAAAMSAAFLYHLWSSEGLRRQGHVRALGVLLGLGLLLKVLFPFYVAGPVALVLYLRYRDFLAERSGGRGPAGPLAFLAELEAPLKTVLGIGAAIALTWYASNLVYVAGYFFRASVGDIAAHYGRTNVWSPGVILRYWSLLAGDALSPYYAALGAILLALAARRRQSPGSGTLMAALWLVLPIAAGTAGVNKEPRIVAPCFPAFALLLARGLDASLGASRAGGIGAALLFIFPVIQYAHLSFGGIVPDGAWRARLLPDRTSFGGPPLGSQGWDHAGLVDAVHQACGGKRAVVAIGTETGIINANNLTYFSELKGYPLSFVSYGYMETRIERTVARFKDKGVTHLLEMRGLSDRILPDHFHAMEAQLQALIKEGRLPFTRVREFQPAPGVTAVLHRLDGEIRLFGAPDPAGRLMKRHKPPRYPPPRRGGG